MKRLFRREDTYKSHEAARRSFFRWVCKKELYGALYFRPVGKRIMHERMPSKFHYGVPFRNGYPVFRDWRSEAYRAWELQFERHKERWESEKLKQFEEE